MSVKILVGNEEVEFNLLGQGQDYAQIELRGKIYSVQLISKSVDELILSFAGRTHSVRLVPLEGGRIHFSLKGEDAVLAPVNKKRAAIDHNQGPISPMPSKLFKIMVKEGDVVDVGTPLLILEAMKMEHMIKASKKAKVLKIHYKLGDLVPVGKVLLDLGDV